MTHGSVSGRGFATALALDLFLELVAGVEGDDPARLDRDRLAGARIPAGAWRLGADLEVAEARDLDVLAFDQAAGDEVEEGVDHVLRLALVQADLLEQELRQLRLGQRGRLQAFHGELHRALVLRCCCEHRSSYARSRAPRRCCSRDTTAATAASICGSVSVASGSASVKRTAMLLSPAAMPAVACFGL